jgi:hypothetical protein
MSGLLAPIIAGGIYVLVLPITNKQAEIPSQSLSLP